MHHTFTSVCAVLGNPEGFPLIHYVHKAVPAAGQAMAAGNELTGKDA
jgi:hypothetical protein